MENQKRRLFNAPEGTKVVPKILIMVRYYWGSADTIENAWKRVNQESGVSVARMKRESHVIYSCFDYINENDDELTVTSYINEMGAICYHRDYPPTVIHQYKKKE